MRKSQSIYFKKVHRLSKSCIQDLLIHTGTPQKVPNAFQEGRNLLEKAEVETNQLNFPKACFKGKVLLGKAGVYFRTCLHGDFLCHGNNFDMNYDNLHSCVTWPKDGKGKVS